jgi:hypothetical protein
MSSEGVVESGARCIIPEPLAGTDMSVKLPAQVVVEAALRQAGKKLAR